MKGGRTGVGRGCFSEKIDKDTRFAFILVDEHTHRVVFLQGVPHLHCRLLSLADGLNTPFPACFILQFIGQRVGLCAYVHAGGIALFRKGGTEHLPVAQVRPDKQHTAFLFKGFVQQFKVFEAGPLRHPSLKAAHPDHVEGEADTPVIASPRNTPASPRFQFRIGPCQVGFDNIPPQAAMVQKKGEKLPEPDQGLFRSLLSPALKRLVKKQLQAVPRPNPPGPPLFLR